jgi:hypothetical protein
MRPQILKTWDQSFVAVLKKFTPLAGHEPRCIRDLNDKAFRYEFAANIRNNLDVTTEALNNVPDFVEGIRAPARHGLLWWQ